MKKNERTKFLEKALLVCKISDYLILLAPLFIYFVIGLSEGDIVGKKVALCGTFMIAIIMCVLNIIGQKHLRSPIWICILGLYIAVDNIIPLLIIVALGSILDEFFFTPKIKKLKMQVVANQEMDKREK